MIRIRRIAAVAAVGLAGAVFSPAALALEPAAVPAASHHSVDGSSEAAINPVEYADRTIRAFGAGDDPTFGELTTRDARDAIVVHGAAPTHWQRAAAEGAAGHVYVTYVNSVTHDHLTIGVNTTGGMNHDHLVDQAR